MGKATVILILVCSLSWALTYANEKWKRIATIITFLSIGSLLLSVINFFIGYDPLVIIKENIVNFQFSKDDQISTNTQPPPFEVLIPTESHTTNSSNKTVDADKPQFAYETTTVILNIEQKVYRDDDNKVLFIWVPIAGRNEYKLKIEVDDPFSSGETDLEFTFKSSFKYVDVSAYDRDTVMFASVGVWSESEAQWVYTNPINFTLY